MLGRTFRYVETGAEGLAGGRRVIGALARGGVYSDGRPIAEGEHAETLLRTVARFIDISDAQFIVAEGVALGEAPRCAAFEAALEQVGQLKTSQESLR